MSFLHDCVSLQIPAWWFHTKISVSHTAAGGGPRGGGGGGQNSSCSSQHAASSLCDEIVTLWRLAALNPAISPIQREDLEQQLKEWHIKSIEKARKPRAQSGAVTMQQGGSAAANTIKRADIENFSGFKQAIDACRLNWDDYVIAGVTYDDKYPLQWHFTFGRQQECHMNPATNNDATNPSAPLSRGSTAGTSAHDSRKGGRPHVSQVSGCGMNPLEGPLAHLYHMKSQEFAAQRNGVGNSYGYVPANRMHAHAAKNAKHDVSDGSSSEGFCESDRRDSKDQHDSDSDLGADIADVTAGATAFRSGTSGGSGDARSSSRKFPADSAHALNVGGAQVSPAINTSSTSSSPSSSKTVVVNTNTSHQAAAASVLHIPAHVKVMTSDDLVDDDGNALLGATAAVTSSKTSTNNSSSANAQAPSTSAKPTSAAAAGDAKPMTSQASASAGVGRQVSLADSQQSSTASTNDEFSVSDNVFTKLATFLFCPLIMKN